MLAIGGALMLVTAALGSGSGSAGAGTPADSPSVVAQGVIELGDEGYAWEHAVHLVTADGAAFAASAPAFLMAMPESTVLLRAYDGGQALIEPGESVFSPDEAVTWTAIALAESSAELALVRIVPADGDGAFVPGPGLHDVELRRFVIAPGSDVALDGVTPAFVVVVEGSVSDASGTSVDPTTPAAVDGSTTLTNAGDSAAVVLVAVIGPPLQLTAATTPTSTRAVPTTVAPPTTV
jgi:hypothetical protein